MQEDEKDYTMYNPTLVFTSMKISFFTLLSILFLSNYTFSQGQATLAGSGTWSVPCGVTSINILVWGGGGAGGAADGNGDMGDGGSSGAYSSITVAVNAGDQFDFSVGAGGLGGSGNGGNGGASTISNIAYAGSVNIVANGGLGGTQNEPGSAGGVVTSSGGSVNIDGNPGTEAVGSLASGDGGTAPNGGGPGGNGAGGCADGNPGFGPGGGGAGATHICNGGSNSGGAGGIGAVIITWTPISAGTDVLLSSCNTVLPLSADAAPVGTTGTWSIAPADGSTITPSMTDPNGTFNASTIGQNYTLTWTITGVGCTPSFDAITVITSGPAANAGFNQSLCSATYTMAGNTAEAGFTGTWTVISGNVSIPPGTENDPTATILSTMISGECATLRWTVAGACTEFDEVVVCNPVTCNDDPCGAIALPTNLACVTSNYPGIINNALITETTNPGRPGCGQFGLDDGFDVWYSATVPLNGELNVDVGGAAGDYVSMAIYTGTCNNLSLSSCHQNATSGATITAQESGLTPGSTVWIRVWDYFDLSPSDVNICVYENNNPSDVTPGDNSMVCGASYTFYDGGGNTGNYGNNVNTTYTICPADPSQVVSVTFNSMVMGSSLDHMLVLNGSGGAAQLVGDFYNGTPTFTSTANDGCLTFIFLSNQTINAAGWDATVSCVAPSPTDGANHLTNTCTEQNCLGGCLRTLCGIPATVGFQGDGPGNQELTMNTNGCWSSGERCSNWFYINPTSAGDLSLNLYVNNGQDQDFLVWEAFGEELQCPADVGGEALSCNFAGATSQGTGFNDALTATNPAYEPSLQISQTDIDNGLYYIVLIQTYSNGASCPQPDVTTTFGGSASLGCSAPIPLNINLLHFSGQTEERHNEIYWSTASETNNYYFTVESSLDNSTWRKVEVVNGSGTTTAQNDYSIRDYNYNSQVIYYRIKQTDFDGAETTTNVIALVRELDINEIVSNIYPNPSSGEFFFSYGGQQYNIPVQIEIYNSIGQLVLTQTYDGLKKGMALSFDLSELSNGIYTAEVRQGDLFEIQKLSIVK